MIHIKLELIKGNKSFCGLITDTALTKEKRSKEKRQLNYSLSSIYVCERSNQTRFTAHSLSESDPDPQKPSETIAQIQPHTCVWSKSDQMMKCVCKEEDKIREHLLRFAGFLPVRKR